jgi:hypothetical protein
LNEADAPATGQLGRRPFVCVWDAMNGCQQLQKIVHPSGMRGVIALGFSQSDGGQHITAVNSDNGHTVMVWRWSKRGDEAGTSPSFHRCPTLIHSIGART